MLQNIARYRWIPWHVIPGLTITAVPQMLCNISMSRFQLCHHAMTATYDTTGQTIELFFSGSKPKQLFCMTYKHKCGGCALAHPTFFTKEVQPKSCLIVVPSKIFSLATTCVGCWQQSQNNLGQTIGLSHYYNYGSKQWFCISYKLVVCVMS